MPLHADVLPAVERRLHSFGFGGNASAHASTEEYVRAHIKTIRVLDVGSE